MTVFFKKKLEFDINNIINEDNKNELINLIKHKDCKNRIIKYIIIWKYILLIVGTCLIFLSWTVENENNSKILAIASGCINTTVFSFDKIIDESKKLIVKIKKILNKKISFINKKTQKKK